MKPRKFNSFMPIANHKWAASVLNMQVNGEKGPDLIDEKKRVELKFTLVEPIGRTDYPKAWTVLEHQMEYNNGKPCFWGLGTYRLSIPVKEIRTSSPEELELLVEERQLWIVPWDWMQHYQPMQSSGKTPRSEWNNVLRYPKLKDIPKVVRTYEVDKGHVYITRGIPERLFQVRTPEVPF